MTPQEYMKIWKIYDQCCSGFAIRSEERTRVEDVIRNRNVRGDAYSLTSLYIPTSSLALPSVSECLAAFRNVEDTGSRMINRVKNTVMNIIGFGHDRVLLAFTTSVPLGGVWDYERQMLLSKCGSSTRGITWGEYREIGQCEELVGFVLDRFRDKKP